MAKHFSVAWQDALLSHAWISLQHFARVHVSHAGRSSTDACIEQSGAPLEPLEPLLPLEPLEPLDPLDPLLPPSFVGLRGGRSFPFELELEPHPMTTKTPNAIPEATAKNALRTTDLRRSACHRAANGAMDGTRPGGTVGDPHTPVQQVDVTALSAGTHLATCHSGGSS
ncbi:MAG TPA: hypothetical protein VIF62_36785 [Labilithrix sp.]